MITVSSPAAAEAGEDAERGADEAAHDHGGEAHQQRHARAVDHAREHVAAEVIGAEQCARPSAASERRRGTSRPRSDWRVGSCGREPRRGQRATTREQQRRSRAPPRPAAARAGRRRRRRARRRTRRSRSAGADAGIEEAIEQIDDEVDDDEHRARRGTPRTARPDSRGCRSTGWRAARCPATRRPSPSPPRRRAGVPNCSPVMVTMGIAAFLSVCLATTSSLGHALGPRGADVVGAQHLEHGRAGEPRDRGHGEGARGSARAARGASSRRGPTWAASRPSARRSRMNRMPRKNVGADWPTRATPIAAWSSGELRLTAESRPMGTATSDGQAEGGRGRARAVAGR